MKFFSVVAFVILFILSSLYIFVNLEKDTIKIGLLYSKTGTMSVEEEVIAKIVHYQVETINKQGGLLNSKIEIIEYDGKSDPKEFAKGAEYLLSKGVTTIFGCWTSASRKAVKPIVEKNNSLLFYPVQYEGVESSKNIIYLGSVPNQQVNPALNYIQNNFGKKVYIVGSDYIYPRMGEVYLKELSRYIDIEIVGSDFIPLGSSNFTDIIETIKVKKPDVIINMLNGKSNNAFFKALSLENLYSNKLPVFSFSIDEKTISYIGEEYLQGHYVVNGYFNTIQSHQNSTLQLNLKKRFGEEFILTDAGYNIYLGVEFWKKAVENTQNTDTNSLLKHLQGDSLNSIMGIVYIDPKTNHLYKNIRIGKVNNEHFDIVWENDILTKPSPFPIIRKKEFWLKEENKLYTLWNQSWQYSSGKEVNDE